LTSELERLVSFNVFNPLELKCLIFWFQSLSFSCNLCRYTALGYDAVVCIRPPAVATLFPALGDAFAASALSAMEAIQRRLAAEQAEEDEEDAEVDPADAASQSQAVAAAATSSAAAAEREGGASQQQEEEKETDRPVLLHLFSNGGYLFAGNVMHAHSGSAKEATSASDVVLRWGLYKNNPVVTHSARKRLVTQPLSL
jgi:hypothetical protein